MNLQKFKDELEEWLNLQISSNFIKERQPKIIRDPVHGIQKFNGWEINFIDLPIIQRLRNIKQNAFAYYIYPGALHSRFDHTLGVAILTEKFINTMQKMGTTVINDTVYHSLRIAAIFHDVGHGPFSHLSEEIYSNLSPIRELMKEKTYSAIAQNAKAHELISYFIVESDVLKDLFKKTNKIYIKNLRGPIDENIISESIIGNMSDLRYKYCQDIINGSFDADKLDYIQRDCFFTGLQMSIDVDRIFNNIVLKEDNNKFELALDVKGSHDLEQLLFNKLLLYPSLYHHHKIRAVSCMFKSIFEILYDYDMELDGKRFDNPIDFLKVDDTFFKSLNNKPSLIRPIIKNILDRALLKRALVFGKDFVKGEKEEIDFNYKDFMKNLNNYEKVRELRELIAEKVKGITCYDVWIDLPEPPSLREASQCSIRVRQDKYETLDKLFPSSGWLNTFSEHKLKGYIFCPPKKRIRENVYKEATKIFSEYFGIEFTKDCYYLAKIK
ncbi:MAG: HD domain-containing protein [Promethearchaeota archaeon]